MAAPAAAAGNGHGTPKTSAEHPSWIELDSFPTTTSSDHVTLSGKVAGNFDMAVENGPFSQRFEGKGSFTVDVLLFPGENRIRITGSDRANRYLTCEAVVTRSGGEPESPPAVFDLEVGQNTLVANGLSTMTIRALILDSNGDTVMSYRQPVSFVSSNPAAVSVVTPTVIPWNGYAVATLKAGTVPEEAVITATAPDLSSVSFAITPAPQLAGRVSVIAYPTTLPLGATSPILLNLRLKDSSGLDVYTMTSPLRVQLVTSNSSVATFAGGRPYAELTMTEPAVTIMVYGGTAAGTTVISGAAVRSDGLTVPVETVTVTVVP